MLVDWHTEHAVDQQDQAVAFFTAMAKNYGAYPNVIWEPYNEPARQTWAQIKAYTRRWSRRSGLWTRTT